MVEIELNNRIPNSKNSSESRFKLSKCNAASKQNVNYELHLSRIYINLLNINFIKCFISFQLLLDLLFYMKTNILDYRPVNRQWNRIACEIFSKTQTSPLVLETRMEVLSFNNIMKGSIQPLFLRKFQFCLTDIPIRVLEQFASEFGDQKLEYTFSSKLNNGLTKDVGDQGLALLRQSPNIVSLHIRTRDQFSLENELTEFQLHLPTFTFQHLKRIRWDNNTKMDFLIFLLKKAPRLESLVVGRWWNSGKVRFDIHAIPKVLRVLPARAKLETELCFYYTDPLELESIKEISKFPNRISHLTIAHHYHEPSNIHEMPAWREAIKQLLSSQSVSLLKLKVHATTLFKIPRLDALKTLESDRGFQDESFTPARLPRLMELEITLLSFRKVTSFVWPSVNTVRFGGIGNDADCAKSLAVSFPSASKLFITSATGESMMLCLDSFPELRELQFRLVGEKFPFRVSDLWTDLSCSITPLTESILLSHSFHVGEYPIGNNYPSKPCRT